MRMFCCFSCVVLDVYAFLSAGMQKKKRLRCRRFWFCLGLYKSFFCGLRAGKPPHSLRSATTGSFLAALREGIRPEMRVSRTLMATRMTAAGRGSTA